MNAYPIVSGRLYQRGRHSAMDRGKLAKELGLSYVVTLRGERDDAWVKTGVTYLHWPLKDSKNMPYWCSASAVWLAGEMKRGRKILLYCGGRTRTGMFAALIVRNYLGCSGDVALAYVRSGWPSAVKPTMRPYVEALA